MNETTKMLTKGATLTVVLSAGEYGTRQPEIEVRFPSSASYRARAAALHCLAAEVEAGTTAADTWNVQIVDGNYDKGFVYLDLVHGTEAEAERGMALLRRVIA